MCSGLNFVLCGIILELLYLSIIISDNAVSVFRFFYSDTMNSREMQALFVDSNRNYKYK